MKLLKILLIISVVTAMVFAVTLNASAIGFNAEEVYESVFVVYSGNSLGSGFAIGENCIVTNAHVVSDASDVILKSYGGEKYNAYVLGMDENKDIAVLIVEDAKFPYLYIADKETVFTGDDIYAIGAPKSMTYTLTKGVISAKERQIGGYTYIQIDAPINQGNSGGPLLTDDGYVLGMNTLKMTDSEGIGLAIPVYSICDYVEGLGVELDEKGNVNGNIVVPEQETEAQPDENTGKLPEKIRDNSDTNGLSVITIVAFAVAGVSIVINIILAVMLSHQKKKNLTLKYDPRERTDFDIELLG